MTPASRSTDPVTSNLAEAEVTSSGARRAQADEVLSMARAMPGATSAEIARGHFPTMIKARRRLPDLERAGLVKRGEPRKCNVTGRLSLTWWPV